MNGIISILSNSLKTWDIVLVNNNYEYNLVVVIKGLHHIMKDSRSMPIILEIFNCSSSFMNFVSNGISIPPAEVIKIFINYFNISFIDSIFSLLMFFAAFFPIILKKYFNGIHLFLE